MLILTRKIGESIIINDEITVKLVDIQGAQVRIGIEAPASIDIYREEIYNRIHSTIQKCANQEDTVNA